MDYRKLCPIKTRIREDGRQGYRAELQRIHNLKGMKKGIINKLLNSKLWNSHRNIWRPWIHNIHQRIGKWAFFFKKKEIFKYFVNQQKIDQFLIWSDTQLLLHITYHLGSICIFKSYYCSPFFFLNFQIKSFQLNSEYFNAKVRNKMHFFIFRGKKPHNTKEVYFLKNMHCLM